MTPGTFIRPGADGFYHAHWDEPAPVGTSRQTTLDAPVRPSFTHNNGPAAAATAPAHDPSGESDEHHTE